MEVASILTSNKEVEELLKDFLMNYKYLKFNGIDDDTYYFLNKKYDKHEIFYHTNNDLEYEFSYNFSEENIFLIREYFKDRQIYLLDISFKNKAFFLKLIKDFIMYLVQEDKVNISEILIDDPFEELMTIDNKGNLNKVKM